MRVTNLDTLPGLWAKLAESPSDELRWHSLIGHAADAGAVAEALLANPVLRRRLARLAGQDTLDDATVAKLCALIALHDLGKASRGFQRQVLKDKGALLRGHCAIVLGILDGQYRAKQNQEKFRDAVGLSTLQASLAGGCSILLWEYLSAVMAHHGAPLSDDAIRDAIQKGVSCWTGTPGDDPIDDVRRLTTQVRAWYPALSDPGSLPAAPAFIHAFAGLVTLADWIASDEQLFAMDQGESNERITQSRANVHALITRLGLSGSDLRHALQDRSLDFLDLFGKPPRPAQRAITDFDAAMPGTVVVLEAETGSGKTEAALRHFLGLQRAGAVDGLYFALPLRTAAVQIAERLKRDLRRIVPDLADRLPVVTAVPGYVPVVDHEDGTYLLPVNATSPVVRDDGRSTVRTNWAADHPKRYLAATLAVGTIDQALLSVLPIRHAHLRASAHLRQLLVVDEVHASDIYMRELLKQLVRRHRQAGGHVLLMSATLGSSARSVLLGEDVPAFDAAVAYPYPAISSTDRPTLEVIGTNDSLPVKRVYVEPIEIQNTLDPLIIRVVHAVADGARVLVLRNRVSDAIATQRALELAGVPTLRVDGIPSLHHSRFAREDRERLDRAMLGALGMTSSAPVAVVATQTAEQSLDIDADLLVTDLAPADVLLQRLGRLHRHTRTTRPPQYAAPRLLLLTPPASLFDEQMSQRRPQWRNGWGSVYPNLVALQATLDTFTETGMVEIPSMNRILVEKATHTDWLAGVAEQRGEAWITHLNKFRAMRSAERTFANTAVWDWNEAFSTMNFQSQDVERNIATRLGEQDRLAVFASPVRGVFDTTVTQLRLSAWMCRNTSDDACVTNVHLEGERLRFSFGAHAFAYDRLGLRLADDKLDTVGEREEAGVE